MHPHDNWRELAALDAVGELSADEHRDLQAHLQECADCRAAVAEDTAVAHRWLPAASPARRVRRMPDASEAREAFLARARAEGLRFSEAAAHARPRWLSWAATWNTAPAGAVAALLVVAAVAGGYLVTRMPAVPVIGGAGEAGTRVAELARENEQLRQSLDASRRDHALRLEQLAAVQHESHAARQHSEHLEQVLAAVQAQSAETRQALNRAELQASEAGRRLSAELKELDGLRAQLEQVRTAHAADQVTLIARQNDVDELSRQLRLQAASVERTRELLAANRDIRDLMTARNLHIVDVHDTDARGKQKKAFGRMFYTEGKSLIFYAYDLDSGRTKNASFQVWGEKTGGAREAISLGVLYADDQKQSRWALSFNDPKVLKEIDSVFVTIEAPGGSKKPSNQRMMYAFLLNEANHR